MRDIQPLSELGRSDLALAGGKAANLGAMIQAGLPVPAGFCVTTSAYRQFIEDNGLQARILARLAKIQTSQPDELESASADIRQWFDDCRLPPEISAQISEAYAAISAVNGSALPVAVRSSATAEDLPDLSFAGQQDTYLNIVGEAELLRAVIRCWASLWTARAIGYRARNGIAQDEVALAVVVQQMVASEASGVLFTANPLTGKRAQTVIDATFGLGEALVSGMVEPDHYEVDSTTLQVTSKTLGAKALAIREVAGGGTQVTHDSAADRQALPDAQILELVRLGQRAEQFFGGPQDMEWAWAGEKLYVLQSRPVTSLYPLPEGIPVEPLQVFFSFSHWQGMMDPLSALGQDTFQGVVAGLARGFGSQSDLRSQNVLFAAGERLVVNITGLLRHPLGRKITGGFITWVDPVSHGVIDNLLEDDRLALDTRPMSLISRLRLVRAIFPIAMGVIYTLFWPSRGRARLEAKINQVLAEARASSDRVNGLPELVKALEEGPYSIPSILLPYLLPGVIAGQAPLQMLRRMASPLPDGIQRVMELTRGLPHNVTTEMDLSLWDAAQTIRADAAALARFRQADPAQLVRDYQSGQLPVAARQAVDGFLADYGFRGVAEIDIYRPRWNDDPLHIFQVLQGYLQIEDPNASPRAVFRRGADHAAQTLEGLLVDLRHTRMGWLKVPLGRALAYRVRELGGLRETPKFIIIRVLGTLRRAIVRIGRELAAKGILEREDDIFFLHQWEINELGEGRLPIARELAIRRRVVYNRELNHRRIPRLMLSDGTTYYEGAGLADEPGDGTLTGTPVSAGVVEGIVRVIRDPRGAQLEPGEILVCPATDPAWTPLFLTAGGLVMEVGGMMTHGSVVAREYGIPAVVGVREVTERLQTGQRVRVDGSSGRVQIL